MIIIAQVTALVNIVGGELKGILGLRGCPPH